MHLSEEQIKAICAASSAAEVSEICRAGWVPPNTNEQMAMEAMKAQGPPAEVRKPKYRVNKDGFLEPIE